MGRVAMMSGLGVQAFLISLSAGCGSADQQKANPPPPQRQEQQHSASEARYFASPQDAVARATALMRAEDWATLADYYDLSGTTIDRSDLVSGRFFLRDGVGASRTTTPPLAMGHPQTRYRQPFAPGFAFDHVESTGDPHVVRVVVSIRIDQGGGMTQVGMDSFALSKGRAGYQLLPKSDSRGAAVPPATRPSPAPATASMGDSPDLIHFRPALAERIAKLPPPQIGSLIALLDELDKAKRSLAVAPLPGTTRAVPTAPGVVSYEPLNAELIASEIAQRIERVLTQTPPAAVIAALQADGRDFIDVRYGKILIHHADVAGSGPVYYADPPQSTPIVFKRMTPR